MDAKKLWLGVRMFWKGFRNSLRKCSPGSHVFVDGCKCLCGLEARDEGHDWDGCECKGCSKKRDEGHDWDGFECTKCYRTRLTCAGCGKAYDIGDNAVAVSLEYGLGLAKGAVVIVDANHTEREDLISTLNDMSPDSVKVARERARPSWQVIEKSLACGTLGSGVATRAIQ